MNLSIKKFDELTTRELYELLKVRAAVFVVEQNCVYQDLDEIDYRAVHVFLEEQGEVQAYLRVFEKEEDLAQIGRVLTVKRGIGLGKKIMLEGIRAAKEFMHSRKIYIEAQCYAIDFYKGLGFQVASEEFLEDGIPHVQMIWEE